MKRILLGNGETIQEKDLNKDQLIKYAQDLAWLYERERVERTAAQSTNIRLEKEIRERRSLEEALVKSEWKYRSLFENSGDPLYISSRDGILMMANPAYSKFTEYEEGESLGTSVLRTYADPSQRPIFQKAIEESGVLKDFEIQLLTKNGKILGCSINAIVLRGPDGDILGYQGTIRDVTEQKKNLERAELAKRMEALANMAGGVAHEIRNPLSISSSAAQLLVNDKLDPPSKKECLEKILLGIGRASLIVDNLVTYARNFNEYSVSKVNLIAVVRSVLQSVANQAGSEC